MKFWANQLLNPDVNPVEKLNTMDQNMYLRYVNPDVTEEFCKETVTKDFAFVTIKWGTSIMTKYKRDLTVTFANKIAEMGKF